MKKKLHIILRYGITEKYLFKDLEKEMDIVLIPYMMEAPKNLFLKITRFLIVGRFPLPLCILKIWFDKKFLESLTQIKPTDNLLVFESINPRILGMISLLIPKEVKKYNWFLNPIHSLLNGKNPIYRLREIERFGFENITFDKTDARKFKLSYHTPFIRLPFDSTPVEEDIDFYFCGLAKDREQTLMQLKETLEKANYKCLFIIPGVTQKYGISYDENLQFVKRSKCVIDIYQKEQIGLTRRPLEALFYNKKLLTNNPDIINYDFYNSHNIYVLKQINISGIESFMNLDPIEISPSIKNKYDIRNWLIKFIH